MSDFAIEKPMNEMIPSIAAAAMIFLMFFAVRNFEITSSVTMLVSDMIVI